MYIKITAQKIGEKHPTFNSSVTDYVNYLEKENEGKHPELQEYFFDQYNDRISLETVITEIDGNTKKLNKKTPKFYSIVVSPSAKELKHINNDTALLRKYTRELIKDYAVSFNRDWDVTASDIKFYAKIEHERTFRGFEEKVKANEPYRKQLAKLRHDLAKINRGEVRGDAIKTQREIDRLLAEAPHKIDGKMITEGMKKEGLQTHIHIIVSRKDMTNSHSLSPDAQHKANTTFLNGKAVKQGFDRDAFIKASEKRFDTVFGYNRNFEEQYANRKLYRKDPVKFFAIVAQLPTNEKEIAIKALHKFGIPTTQKGAAIQLFHKAGIPITSIPTNKVQLAIKAFRKLKKGLDKAIQSGSIGI